MQFAFRRAALYQPAKLATTRMRIRRRQSEDFPECRAASEALCRSQLLCRMN